MKFQAGNTFGRGRPRGATDKKWAKIDFWFGLVHSNLDDLSPEERVRVGLKGMEMLLSKMKELPGTVSVGEESNAEEIERALWELEHPESVSEDASEDCHVANVR